MLHFKILNDQTVQVSKTLVWQAVRSVNTSPHKFQRSSYNDYILPASTMFVQSSNYSQFPQKWTLIQDAYFSKTITKNLRPYPPNSEVHTTAIRHCWSHRKLRKLVLQREFYAVASWTQGTGLNNFTVAVKRHMSQGNMVLFLIAAAFNGSSLFYFSISVLTRYLCCWETTNIWWGITKRDSKCLIISLMAS